MPSIEIACIGLTTALPPPATSFAVVYGEGLNSHRSPHSRFQREFDGLSGSLYHVGSPQFAGTASGPFFAYDVLSEASRHADPPSFLEFAPEHVAGVQVLVAWLLDASPEGRLLFTTDWQFGPEGARLCDALELSEFWRLHSRRELLLNAAYPIEHAG